MIESTPSSVSSNGTTNNNNYASFLWGLAGGIAFGMLFAVGLFVIWPIFDVANTAPKAGVYIVVMAMVTAAFLGAASQSPHPSKARQFYAGLMVGAVLFELLGIGSLVFG